MARRWLEVVREDPRPLAWCSLVCLSAAPWAAPGVEEEEEEGALAADSVTGFVTAAAASCCCC